MVEAWGYSALQPDREEVLGVFNFFADCYDLPAIVAEDPERAFAHASPQWLHLLNRYVVRDAFAKREPALTDPYT